MSSDTNFDDEPSMAEILASVRRIVSDEKTPYLSMDDTPPPEEPSPVTKETQEASTDLEPTNRSDILQRLLRKQADLEGENKGNDQANSAPTLSANPNSALSFQPLKSEKSKRVEPKLNKVEPKQLEEDEIQILDLSNPVRPSNKSQETEANPTDPEPTPETKVGSSDTDKQDLEKAIQVWAEGAGKPLLKKMIRDEIGDLFRSTFTP